MESVGTQPRQHASRVGFQVEDIQFAPSADVELLDLDKMLGYEEVKQSLGIFKQAPGLLTTP